MSVITADTVNAEDIRGIQFDLLRAIKSTDAQYIQDAIREFIKMNLSGEFDIETMGVPDILFEDVQISYEQSIMPAFEQVIKGQKDSGNDTKVHVMDIIDREMLKQFLNINAVDVTGEKQYTCYRYNRTVISPKYVGILLKLINKFRGEKPTDEKLAVKVLMFVYMLGLFDEYDDKDFVPIPRVDISVANVLETIYPDQMYTDRMKSFKQVVFDETDVNKITVVFADGKPNVEASIEPLVGMIQEELRVSIDVDRIEIAFGAINMYGSMLFAALSGKYNDAGDVYGFDNTRLFTGQSARYICNYLCMLVQTLLMNMGDNKVQFINGPPDAKPEDLIVDGSTVPAANPENPVPEKIVETPVVEQEQQKPEEEKPEEKQPEQQNQEGEQQGGQQQDAPEQQPEQEQKQDAPEQQEQQKHPEPEQKEQKQDDASPSLSTGAKIGIVVGVIVLLLLIGFCIYWFGFRNKNSSASSRQYEHLSSNESFEHDPADMQSTDSPSAEEI